MNRMNGGMAFTSGFAFCFAQEAPPDWKNCSGLEYTSARLLSEDKFDFRYGRVEIRAQVCFQSNEYSKLRHLLIFLVALSCLLGWDFGPLFGCLELTWTLGLGGQNAAR